MQSSTGGEQESDCPDGPGRHAQRLDGVVRAWSVEQLGGAADREHDRERDRCGTSTDQRDPHPLRRARLGAGHCLVLRIGLTGGIGAGKSAVSRLLAAHGAVVVDADLRGSRGRRPRVTGLAAVVAEFGPRSWRRTGRSTGRGSRSLVFADPAAGCAR